MMTTGCLHVLKMRSIVPLAQRKHKQCGEYDKKRVIPFSDFPSSVWITFGISGVGLRRRRLFGVCRWFVGVIGTATHKPKYVRLFFVRRSQCIGIAGWHASSSNIGCRFSGDPDGCSKIQSSVRLRMALESGVSYSPA